MRVPLTILSLIAFISVAFTSDDLVKLAFPSHFPEPVYGFENNPLTQEKINLGRMLFYDPILSKDQTISCADCHSPYNAFAHTDHNLSHGINDSIGVRNAPALFNLAWQSTFMWDGAIHNLDMQALAPISHPAEMDENIANVVKKLNTQIKYKNAFTKAWNDSTATGEHVLKSISQFQLTLVSGSSKYDAVKSGTESFSKQEKSGYNLFQNHCNNCHTEPLFSSYSFANNGLPIDNQLHDLGRSTISGQDADQLKFKIPSLRNLSYTYPYMHDGRFDKLHQVLNHYAHLKQGDSPEKSLQQAIPLSSADKADLIAFLLTLDDPDFVFNPNNKYPHELLSENENQ
jgi:cytochrome c peroxidase